MKQLVQYDRTTRRILRTYWSNLEWTPERIASLALPAESDTAVVEGVTLTEPFSGEDPLDCDYVPGTGVVPRTTELTARRTAETTRVDQRRIARLKAQEILDMQKTAFATMTAAQRDELLFDGLRAAFVLMWELAQRD